MSVLPVYAFGTARVQTSGSWWLIPLLPRNLVLAALHGYRATISHSYGDVCKYFPSCSAYAVGAVQQYGAAVGTALAARRLARCHPWAQGGIDDVPLKPNFRYQLTRRGFVVPGPRGRD